MLDHDDENDGESADGDDCVSVSEFADILQMPLEMLLCQFAYAGVKLSGPQDLLTDEMKERLLGYLKMPRIIH